MGGVFDDAFQHRRALLKKDLAIPLRIIIHRQTDR